jgi:hypothetical protein
MEEEKGQKIFERRVGKMKKGLVVIAFALLTVLVASGSASAWHRHAHFGFGFFVAPPVVVAPPPVYYYPPYDYGYSYRSHKAWMPGYWSWQRTPYSAWERVWIPGYWDYR